MNFPLHIQSQMISFFLPLPDQQSSHLLASNPVGSLGLSESSLWRSSCHCFPCPVWDVCSRMILSSCLSNLVTTRGPSPSTHCLKQDVPPLRLGCPPALASSTGSHGPSREQLPPGGLSLPSPSQSLSGQWAWLPLQHWPHFYDVS